MRLRHIPGSEKAVDENPYVLTDAKKYRGRFNELYGAGLPVKIEIGCGKGRFITELALGDPSGIYIGIERYSSVLLHALKKTAEKDIPNLRYICMDASELNDVFAPGEVDKIYLNFPDPWPKDRHEKRRLTSPGFLKIYRDILRENGRLEFKTDNRELFDYSLESLKNAGWKITDATEDLYSGGSGIPEGNVQTEYEIKFSGQGIPICRLVAVCMQPAYI